MNGRRMAALLAAAWVAGLVRAAVPEMMSYQGRLTVGGTNYTGTATLKFAVVDAGTDVSETATAFAMAMGGFIGGVFVMEGGAAYSAAPEVQVTDDFGSGAVLQAQVSAEGAVTNIVIVNGGHDYVMPVVTIAAPPPLLSHVTYWSNDGTPSGEPTNGVSVTVTKGLFSVLLGDTSLPNMNALPASVFATGDEHVRVWASTGGAFQLLAPNRRVGAVPYAMLAASVPPDTITGWQIADGSITAWDIGVDEVWYWNIHDDAVRTEHIYAGAVTGAKILDGTVANADLAPNAVTGGKVADGTLALADLGASGAAAGQVPKWNGSAWAPANDLTSGGYTLAGYKENGTFVPSPQATGTDAIALGQGNSAGADRSTIGGGSGNTIGSGATAAAVGGGQNNNIQASSLYATIAGGRDGLIMSPAPYATIGGGYGNTVHYNADHATIAGGKYNAIKGYATNAVVSGGHENVVDVDGFHAVIAGGSGNRIGRRTTGAVIGGGARNGISNDAPCAVVAGGYNNRIDINSPYATVAGGWSIGIGVCSTGAVVVGGYNNGIGARAPCAVVGGGDNNIVGPDSDHATVAGGRSNRVGTRVPYGTVGGGTQNQIGNESDAATVAGGYGNDIDLDAPFSTVSGGEYNRISTWVDHATIGGGGLNDIGGIAGFATIAGGQENQVHGEAATISGGRLNAIGSTWGTIAGGYANQIDFETPGAAVGGGGVNGIGARATYATVAGGYNNTIDEDARRATISGGDGNRVGAAAAYATVSGGNNNKANAAGATVPGGAGNICSGSYGLAAGQHARVMHNGAFVWGDSSTSDYVDSASANSWTIRAAGGYRLFSNAAGSIGAALAPGDSAWSALSDRESKREIQPLDGGVVLAKLATLPVCSWQYRDDPAGRTHYGPIAQDFHAAFGLGNDERMINTGDLDGVALAAIQGLKHENDELKARVAKLEQTLEKLSAALPAGE